MERSGPPSKRQLREWDLEDEIDNWFIEQSQLCYENWGLTDNYFAAIRNLRNHYRFKLSQIKHRLDIEFWED